MENYRLPKHLRSDVEGINDDGRVGAIFRDREDLPAAEDLTASVKEALASSEALVVLCSPNAQKSPWVTREIELFRELHPNRPVLAALLAGEPHEAFPALLRDGREPLAADLRKDGDGPRLGLLKVVAGIAGVPLDVLVNRDAQRRVRRVTAITVAAVVAMVVMALMTSFAIQSRNEAQKQQAEAEGLVEYMLTDLRDDLKGVGRLDVMGEVNERAMEYYNGQGDLSGLRADSLQRRARILHAMGEDDEKRKNVDLALRKYKEARRITSELVTRDPKNPDFIFAETQSLLYLALFHRNSGEDELAILLNLEAQEFSQRLEKLQRDDRFVEQSASIYGNLCAIAVSSNTLDNASERNCKQALALKEEIANRRPSDFEYLSELANQHAWYGDFLIRQERTAEGLEHLDRHLMIVDQLMKDDSENLQWTEQGVRSRIGYAGILRKLGEDEKADRVAEMAVSFGQRLVRHDPANSRWRELFMRAQN